MKFIDNINTTVHRDLKKTLTKECRISIAASYFSIFAFEALKEELQDISQLRFIFTSPTFIAEKTVKEKREFYIPRLGRERNLYGTEFEVKLRNELSQRAIAKECAEWIKHKVLFKSNTTKSRVESRMRISVMTSTGDDDLINEEEKGSLEYRSKQLKRLQDEVVDLEEMNDGVSIIDLGLNEFRLDLLEYINQHGNIDKVPFGLHAIVAAKDGLKPGVVYVLKNINKGVNIDSQNRLHPFYLVYISDNEEIICNHLQPKKMLDIIRLMCKGINEPNFDLCNSFNAETKDGRMMGRYSHLLGQAISSVVNVKQESELDSFFMAAETSALESYISGLNDFELICFIVVR